MHFSTVTMTGALLAGGGWRVTAARVGLALQGPELSTDEVSSVASCQLILHCHLLHGLHLMQRLLLDTICYANPILLSCFPAFRTRMHTQIRRMHKFNSDSKMQEKELLASCLKSNPMLLWKLVTEAYNAAASTQSLAQRDGTSLGNMLRRSSHPAIQFGRCSRALQLQSAKHVHQLHTLLQPMLAAEDSVRLRVLAEHGKMVMRLCKTAEVGVFEALDRLPGDIGSQQWVKCLEQQCLIEAEIRFWQGAFCKKFALANATMEQVRQLCCCCRTA